MTVKRTCEECGKSFKSDSAIVREKNLQYEVQEHSNVCYSCLIENDLTFKIHMAMSFMDTANLLEVTRAGVKSESTKKDKSESEYTNLRRKHVAHFIYALIFEISIKIIYGIEKKKVAPHNHKILDLYNQLSPRVQQGIRNFYDLQVSHTKKILLEFFNGVKTESGKTINIKPANLEEALELNEKVVRDFKYNARLKGKSSALGSLIWDTEHELQWDIPKPELIIFPKLLLDYAISLQKVNSKVKSDE